MLKLLFPIRQPAFQILHLQDQLSSYLFLIFFQHPKILFLTGTKSGEAGEKLEALKVYISPFATFFVIRSLNLNIPLSVVHVH